MMVYGFSGKYLIKPKANEAMETLRAVIELLCGALVGIAFCALFFKLFKIDWYWGDRFAEAVRDDLLDRYEKGTLDLRSPEECKMDQLLDEVQDLKKEVEKLSKDNTK